MSPSVRGRGVGRGEGRGAAGRGAGRGEGRGAAGRGAGRGEGRGTAGRVAGRGEGRGAVGLGAGRGEGRGAAGLGAGRGEGRGAAGLGAGRGAVGLAGGRGRSIPSTSVGPTTLGTHSSSRSSSIGASVSRMSLATPMTSIGETNGESTAPDATEEEGTYGLIQLEVLPDGYIEPYDEIPKACTRAFKKVDNPTGYTWSLTPKDVKTSYWEEFKKQFIWDPKHENHIQNEWTSRAARRYRDFVHGMKKPTIKAVDRRSVKPIYITTAAWEGWLEYWDREDVKAKSETAKRCRMSEPEGEGTGRITHRLGSKSIMKLAHELSKERGGVPVKNCMYDAYCQGHMNPDGTFTDVKSENIHNKIVEYVEQQALEGREVTYNDAYLHVVKLDEKNRMFGAGGLAKTVGSDLSSTGTSHFHSEVDDRFSQMQKELEEARQEREAARQEREEARLERQRLADHAKKLEEHAKKLEERLDQFMAQSSRNDSDLPPPP